MAEMYVLEIPGADGETDTLPGGPTLKFAESLARNMYEAWGLHFRHTIVRLDEKVAHARVLRTQARYLLAVYVRVNAAAYDAELEALDG